MHISNSIVFVLVVPIERPPKGRELLANTKKLIAFALKSPDERRDVLSPHLKSHMVEFFPNCVARRASQYQAMSSSKYTFAIYLS